MIINYIKLREMLKVMGMIEDKHLDQQESVERALLFELWQVLRGDIRDEVSSNDLHTALMILMKIPCEKLSHKPRLEEEEEDAVFGYIDERNKFKLRFDEEKNF